MPDTALWWELNYHVNTCTRILTSKILLNHSQCVQCIVAEEKLDANTNSMKEKSMCVLQPRTHLSFYISSSVNPLMLYPGSSKSSVLVSTGYSQSESGVSLAVCPSED